MSNKDRGRKVELDIGRSARPQFRKRAEYSRALGSHASCLNSPSSHMLPAHSRSSSGPRVQKLKIWLSIRLGGSRSLHVALASASPGPCTRHRFLVVLRDKSKCNVRGSPLKHQPAHGTFQSDDLLVGKEIFSILSGPPGSHNCL